MAEQATVSLPPIETHPNPQPEFLDAWDWYVGLVETLIRERMTAMAVVMGREASRDERRIAEITVYVVDRALQASGADCLKWTIKRRLEQEEANVGGDVVQRMMDTEATR